MSNNKGGISDLGKIIILITTFLFARKAIKYADKNPEKAANIIRTGCGCLSIYFLLLIAGAIIMAVGVFINEPPTLQRLPNETDRSYEWRAAKYKDEYDCKTCPVSDWDGSEGYDDSTKSYY